MGRREGHQQWQQPWRLGVGAPPLGRVWNQQEFLARTHSAEELAKCSPRNPCSPPPPPPFAVFISPGSNLCYTSLQASPTLAAH